MADKLPVLALLKQGFVLVPKYFRRMLPYFGVMLVILILEGVLNAWLMMGEQETKALLQGFLLIDGLLSIPLSNSIIRLIIQGEQARVGFSFKNEEGLTIIVSLKFLIPLLCIALAVALLGFTTMSLFGQTHPWLAAPVFLPLGLAAGYLISRLILVFPAAALGYSLSQSDCFKLCAGNGWQLLALFAAELLVVNAPDIISAALFGDGVTTALVKVATGLLSLVLNPILLALAFQHLMPDEEYAPAANI